MKQKAGLSILDAVLFALCGGIWLYKGFFSEEQVRWTTVILGLVWLAGAGIWIIRAVKEKRSRSGRTTDQRS